MTGYGRTDVERQGAEASGSGPQGGSSLRPIDYSMMTSLNQEEIEEIQRVAIRWTAAVEAGDVEVLGQLMTEDIVVIHGNGRLVRGKEAALNDFARSLKDFSVQQTVQPE